MYDHMDFALTSLDMFSGISENLINYAFNVGFFLHVFLFPFILPPSEIVDGIV